MNSNYVYRILDEIFTEIFCEDFYGDEQVNCRDYRGVIEVETDVRNFAIISKKLSERGWVPAVKGLPKRLLVCVEFDCSGDDFLGLRIAVKVNDLNNWSKRYDKNGHRGPVPRLTDILNDFIHGDKNAVEKINMLAEAC